MLHTKKSFLSNLSLFMLFLTTSAYAESNPLPREVDQLQPVTDEIATFGLLFRIQGIQDLRKKMNRDNFYYLIQGQVFIFTDNIVRGNRITQVYAITSCGLTKSIDIGGKARVVKHA